MGKFYAVRKGRRPGIYATWAACQEQVLKFPQAEFKSFASKSAAEAFLTQTNQLGQVNVKPTTSQDEKDHMHVYVDGSYEHRLKRYGYGGVILYNQTEETFHGGGDEPEWAALRNVAGEMKGAMEAVNRALAAGAKMVTIYYDYQGIAKWALGEWKTNNPYTTDYKAFMQAQARQIPINFEKVKAHTGDHYNELADELAKKGVKSSAR